MNGISDTNDTSDTMNAMSVMNISIPNQDRVITAYGHDAQTMVHMEECAELIQAVSKMRRIVNSIGGPLDPYRSDEEAKAYENLVEEMADVLICLAQMKSMYGIYESELQDMVDMKCARQSKRLEGTGDAGKAGQHGHV